MTRRVEVKKRSEIPQEVVESFAREWKGFLADGLPSGWYAGFRKRAEKEARRHGQSFAEFWPLVHKRSHELDEPRVSA